MTSLAGRLRPVWPVLASASAASTLLTLLLIIARGDDVPVFLVHLVVFTLAAGAAYLLDDTATQVTEVVPRPLIRRRARIVILGFVVIALGWAAVAAMLRWRSPSAPLAALTWEVAGLSCLAVAAAAVVARRGEVEPGNMVASAAALVFIGALVVQPMLHVTLLVSSRDDPAGGRWWAAMIVTALITFAISSRDRASGRQSSTARTE